MGYLHVELTVAAHVSRHNSSRDARDNRAWNRFIDQVQALAAQPEYAEINLMVVAFPLDETDWTPS